MPFYSRKATRIPAYDYSSCNYYFITICTHDKKCIFGKPNELNICGQITDQHILQLPTYYQGVYVDKYVVMPNHVHMIIVMSGTNNPPVTQVVGQLKTGITKEIRRNYPDMDVWQRSFHDHIIRNQTGYEKIWMYIENNPIQWEEDCFYSVLCDE